MTGQLIGVDGKPLTSRHEKTRRSPLAKYAAAQTTPGNRRHWEMEDLRPGKDLRPLWGLLLVTWARNA
ncbi:hypothetical protein [Crateriforma spongiae]|uniref:hypothetical protein n=1 Tax=Crateriforma spongiae TaxID=2724528 RepID=UPI0014472453|nr:hypothetical protein [Crateriforma spongiae]